MENKEIIIDGVDVSECPYYIHKDGSCSSHDCECIKCIHNVCFYKDYKAKEQKCEGLKRDLHKNFEAKDKLHLIIDRLLEASGYDTNTASAEDFEDVYENMRYEKQQLKLKEQKLERITNMLFIGQCSNCEGYSPNCSNKELCDFKHNIKNIIDEVENER